MKKKILRLTSLAAGFFLKAAAQEISFDKRGWKFTTGDSAQWASPNLYNDKNWTTHQCIISPGSRRAIQTTMVLAGTGCMWLSPRP